MGNIFAICRNVFLLLKKLNVRESLKTGTKVAFEEMEHEFPFATFQMWKTGLTL